MLALLRRSLPSPAEEKPDVKRARLVTNEFTESTIEKRISSGYYTSKEHITQDVVRLRQDNASTETAAKAELDPELESIADKFMALLHSSLSKTSSSTENGASTPGQIIMLRSITEKGSTTLYSGLQTIAPSEHDSVINGRKLPNGFDLAEPVKLDPLFLGQTKQLRKFADVFGPHRNTRALEMPRTQPAMRSNTLKFRADPFPERAGAYNRQDYRHQQLATSTWVDYSKGHSLDEQDISRKYRDKGVAAHDFRAALIANDHSVNESTNNISLFKRAFSSFAPVTDSTLSLVNEQDRNRSWWKKQGQKRISKIFTSEYPDLEEAPLINQKDVESETFDDVLSYDPEKDAVPPSPQVEPETVDDVLEEVSQLLETVHSYQRIRSLETRQSADSAKPSTAEFDTYTMLRDQLAILIASVPPFLVAKLDGNKLSDLNISTNLRLESVDYRGTLKADDATLAKYRAAHQSAVSRVQPVAPPVAAPRPQYNAPPQTAASHYTSNLQAYAQNLGVQAQQAQRQAQQYATPQNVQQRATYGGYQPTQTPSQPQSYTAQPTVQQFQRPPSASVNAYNSGWNTTKGATPGVGTPAPATTTTSNVNYGHTPSQPGYQQRAQRVHQPLDYNAVAMQHTPQIRTPTGLVNGAATAAHGYYPQQQHHPQTQVGASAGYTPRPVSQGQYQ